MDLLDRLLGHDAWTTRQLLDLCGSLTEKQLDQEYDIGHRSLRATLTHLIKNMEVWSALMANQDIDPRTDTSVSGLIGRLEVAAARLQSVSREVSNRNGWDETWVDRLDNPPRQKTFGAGIAHLVTHSMHHRAQILYLLRRVGVTNLPEGDVFSWEHRDKA